MKLSIAAGLLAGAFFVAAGTGISSDEATPPIPVLVELFTSEGCSSCPPADALLERLDREQPVPGALLVVLSEHVDYWNELGWKDPFSQPFFSERQQRYATRLETRGPYTPQMVVDGRIEFVGSDAREVQKAARSALAQSKVGLKFDSYQIENGVIRARLQTGNLSPAPADRKAELMVLLARNRAASSVTRGENEGRYLPHVATCEAAAPWFRARPCSQERVELDPRSRFAQITR